MAGVLAQIRLSLMQLTLGIQLKNIFHFVRRYLEFLSRNPFVVHPIEWRPAILYEIRNCDEEIRLLSTLLNGGLLFYRKLGIAMKKSVSCTPY